jgi:hypothetical protein
MVRRAQAGRFRFVQRCTEQQAVGAAAVTGSAMTGKVCRHRIMARSNNSGKEQPVVRIDGSTKV